MTLSDMTRINKDCEQAKQERLNRILAELCRIVYDNKFERNSNAN